MPEKLQDAKDLFIREVGFRLWMLGIYLYLCFYSLNTTVEIPSILQRGLAQTLTLTKTGQIAYLA